jgi:hypothetical protein
MQMRKNGSSNAASTVSAAFADEVRKDALPRLLPPVFSGVWPVAAALCGESTQSFLWKICDSV